MGGTDAAGSGFGTALAVAVGLIVIGGAVGLFVVDFGSAEPEPVDFDVPVAVVGLFGWTAASLAIVELTERRPGLALGDRLRAVIGRIRNALHR